MKIAILTGAVAMALAGGAQAAVTHTMTDGTFTFYDAGGVEQVSSGHNDVQGAFNMSGVVGDPPFLGSFNTSTPFNGVTWSADINMMVMHDPNGPAVQSGTYGWTTSTYFVAGVGSKECNSAGILSGCDDLLAANPTAMHLGDVDHAGYSYELTAGQFAAHVFFDWSVNNDIPVLAVMQVTGVDPVTGAMTVVSVDTDNDGLPGTAMLTSPFPGQTPAFNGVIVPVASEVPVPAAVWLLGSGLLGLVGVARRRKSA